MKTYSYFLEWFLSLASSYFLRTVSCIPLMFNIYLVSCIKVLFLNSVLKCTLSWHVDTGHFFLPWKRLWFARLLRLRNLKQLDNSTIGAWLSYCYLLYLSPVLVWHCSFFGGPCCETCRILIPWSGVEPIPPTVEWTLRVLTTVPPGKSLPSSWLMGNLMSVDIQLYMGLVSSHLLFPHCSRPNPSPCCINSISGKSVNSAHYSPSLSPLSCPEPHIWSVFWNSLLSFRLFINSPIFHITLRLLCWSTVLTKLIVVLNACLGSPAPEG